MYEKRHNMNLQTEEIARIHAHVCGDGCVYVKKEKRSLRECIKYKRKGGFENVYIIEYTNTCIELLTQFHNDLKIAFNREGQWKLKDHKIKVTHVKWILELLSLLNKNSYNWFVPNFIKTANKFVISNWIKAFFDDESTITNFGSVRVKSMNNFGLYQVKNLLKLFDIYPSITGPNCDNSYYLTIFAKDSIKYQNNIGFFHPDKIEKLSKIIKRK